MTVLLKQIQSERDAAVAALTQMQTRLTKFRTNVASIVNCDPKLDDDKIVERVSNLAQCADALIPPATGFELDAVVKLQQCLDSARSADLDLAALSALCKHDAALTALVHDVLQDRRQCQHTIHELQRQLEQSRDDRNQRLTKLQETLSAHESAEPEFSTLVAAFQHQQLQIEALHQQSALQTATRAEFTANFDAQTARLQRSLKERAQLLHWASQLIDRATQAPPPTATPATPAPVSTGYQAPPQQVQPSREPKSLFELADVDLTDL